MQGERCHLLITQQVDTMFADYALLAELLRNGYFSTIVTTNTNTMLERVLDSPFTPAHRVFICGSEPDEDVASALDAQESGICIIKLPIHKNGLCVSDIWKSLLDYLKGNIIVFGSINGVHDDIVQTLLAERDKSSMYYIVPVEPRPDKLLSHMQTRQKQPANFLIYEPERMFVDFFAKLTEQLQRLEHDILPDDGQNSEGGATSTSGSGAALQPSTIDEIEDAESDTEPLLAVPPPDGEEMVSSAATEDPAEWEEWSATRLGSLEYGTDESFEDVLMKSGPLELEPSLAEKKNAIGRLPWPRGVDVLLVTVTNVESRAILSRYPERMRRTIHEKTYYDLGYIGRARTVIVQANDMGPIEANATVDEGIRELSPYAVIMTGIAFGVRAKGQQIGDVLVSKLIHDYDSERVGTGEDDQLLSHQRGARATASGWLIDRFNAGNHDWSCPPEIHFGSILSGSKLIDNKEYQTALLRSAPDAIGGEMEGVGLYKAANRHRVHWLLVKGISDWGDGRKGENKSANQKLAAGNAASFVLFVIGHEDFMHKP